jgi:hypothetical protein
MNMHPTVRAARVAGAWYLLNVVTSLFSYIYGNSMVVSGDAAATAHNILANETLYRISIVIGLVAAVAFIMLVRALYRLLGTIDRNQAWLMMTFVLVSIPISFVGALNRFAAVTFMHGGSYLSTFSQSQLDSLGMAALNMSSQVANLNSIFFGLWLLPFGLLVYASGFIPRIFGILLVINCFAYLAISLVAMLGVPPPYSTVFQAVVLLPQAAGELSIMAWLVIKGANVQALQPTPA